jgi:hypothetical protein
MALPTSTGWLNQRENTVVPNNTGTWADLTSWDTFTQWATEPANPLVYNIFPIIDLGSIQTFNLKIITVATGLVSYSVFTSTTGLFAGEETETVINQGDDGIPAFSGRYVVITVRVTVTGGVNVIQGVEYITSQGAVNTISLGDVNTSTLSGTSSARTLTLTRSIGGVTNIQITPKAVASYAVDLYVSSTPTSTTVTPRIISKVEPIQFALVGVDNQPRDAVVDIVLEYLPEGYMSGNNLLVR